MQASCRSVIFSCSVGAYPQPRMFDWIFWHDAIFHLEWILFFHVIHFIWLSALTALLFLYLPSTYFNVCNNFWALLAVLPCEIHFHSPCSVLYFTPLPHLHFCFGCKPRVELELATSAFSLFAWWPGHGLDSFASACLLR